MFGAAYYLEYQPTPDLERDMDLMAEAGFSVIRVGESVWATWEPEDGQFSLDWLEPVLDAAHERGIGVIIGTPTYAAPPWMQRKYPEIAGDIATGKQMPWGHRQEMDFTSPTFLFHAERIIRKIVRRYADHPAVIGWQVDNEPGIRLLYNHAVFQRFIDYLKQLYGTVERLNDEWGLVFWSHKLSVWDDLWLPDGNAQPQYDLAWRRFQADLVTDYIRWQADIVREELGTRDEFVTTCISFDQVGVEDEKLSKALDIASGNAYYDMQDSLAYPSTEPMSSDWIIRGPWGIYQLADLMYSAKQAPFYVTETNAGAIGSGATNSVAYDGQWRQIAWALISRGARMVEYWHWNTNLFGTETFWIGLLPHDGRPGRAYREIARIGAEINAAGSVVAESTPDADISFVYDSDSKWALGFSSVAPLPDSASRNGDADSYRRMTLPFYRAAFDAGLQVNTVRPAQLFRADPAEYAANHPVLVAVGLYTLSDESLRWLVSYASAGGHLVIGPRTGYADPEGRARGESKPAIIADAAGVSYQEFSNLNESIPVTVPAGSPLIVPETASATLWSDYLIPTDATALLGYDHPHHRNWAAATTRPYGDGQITVIGTIPGQSLAEALFRWAVPHPVTAIWGKLPPSIRVTSASLTDGRRLWFVHNWSWDPAGIAVPQDVIDLLDGNSLITSGNALDLGPWDVRVLSDAPRA